MWPPVNVRAFEEKENWGLKLVTFLDLRNLKLIIAIKIIGRFL